MPVARTNDIETYYERHGAGPPVVLVHGGWVDHEMWAPQVEALQDDYELITYDVRGHGETGATSERRYTIDLFADDLKALVDHLGLDRPVICGLSLGGMIAQTYASRYPDGLRGLVLADTSASTGLTASDKLTRVFAPAWAMTGMVNALGPKRYVNVAALLGKGLHGKDWFGHDEATETYVRDRMAAFDTDEYNKVFRAIYRFRGVDLSAITVPTLLLNGEHESPSVFTHAEHLERTIPDTRSAIVPDAGHTSNMENAAAFTDFLREFLDGLD